MNMSIAQYELCVDTSEQRPVHMLIGRNQTYMRLSPSAYQLLKCVRDGRSFADIAKSLCQQGPRLVSATEVEAAYQALERRIDAIEQRSSATQGGFWWRCRLLPPALVSRIAAFFVWAFNPASAALLLGMSAAAAALFVRDGALAANSGDFFPAYGVFLLSLLFHEFGHASACVRYGSMAGEIGLSFYLIYPAFYSNVSAAWTLRRWQRVVVDLGGVYFQLVFCAACVSANALLHSPSLKLGIVFIVGSCLLSLNPILKFDGYWILSDALGVTNLGQQPIRIYHQLLRRLRRQPVKPLPWPSAISLILLLYALISTGFWLSFGAGVLPAFVDAARTYPATAAALFEQRLSSSAWPRWESIERFLTKTYLLLFLSFLLVQFVGRLIRWIRRSSTNPFAARPGASPT